MQELEVLSVPEVAQLCMQVRYAIENHGDAGYTDVLIGRALEVKLLPFDNSSWVGPGAAN